MPEGITEIKMDGNNDFVDTFKLYYVPKDSYEINRTILLELRTLLTAKFRDALLQIRELMRKSRYGRSFMFIVDGDTLSLCFQGEVGLFDVTDFFEFFLSDQLKKIQRVYNTLSMYHNILKIMDGIRRDD